MPEARTGARLACCRMPRRGGLRSHPRDYLAPGLRWPEDELDADAPPEAHLAQGVSRRLRGHLEREELTVRAAAAATDVGVTTLHNIVRGKVWTDIAILARIERRLDVDLWSDEHRDDEGRNEDAVIAGALRSSFGRRSRAGGSRSQSR